MSKMIADCGASLNDLCCSLQSKQLCLRAVADGSLLAPTLHCINSSHCWSEGLGVSQRHAVLESQWPPCNPTILSLQSLLGSGQLTALSWLLHSLPNIGNHSLCLESFQWPLTQVNSCQSREKHTLLFPKGKRCPICFYSWIEHCLIYKMLIGKNEWHLPVPHGPCFCFCCRNRETVFAGSMSAYWCKL